MTGTIEHRSYGNNEDESWSVNSGCEAVHIYSTYFYTESGYDKVTIDGEVHEGQITVDQIVNLAIFDVTFHSDGSTTKEGFTLKWECHVAPEQPALAPSRKY